MKCAVIAAAILAFAAVASAQVSSADNTEFPYATCSRWLDHSVYSTPEVTIFDNTTFCFTFKYDPAQCTYIKNTQCCKTDVHKLELDANWDCNSPRKWSGVTALKKGNSDEWVKSTGAVLRTPPNGKPGQATMYVTQLGLKTPAEINGAMLCVTPDPKLDECKHFREVLANPAQWKTAAWDSSHKCCPVTSETPGCKSTLVYKITYKDGDRYDFENPEVQSFAGPAIEQQVLDTASAAGVTITTSIITYKTADGFSTASIDITFATKEDAAKFAEVIASQGSSFLNAVFLGQDCTLIPGQTPAAELTGCSEALVQGSACAIFYPPPPVERPPFPFCPCQKDEYATQFYISDFVYDDIWANITVVGGGEAIGNAVCKATDEMDKVEFWLKESMKKSFVGSYITYGTVVDKFKAPSWGGKQYPDTFKVAQLGLYADDMPLKVAIKLKATAAGSWETLSGDPDGHLWAALFDPNVKCCPTYGTMV